MLTSMAGPDLSLNVGDVTDRPDAEAARLIAAGYAEAVAPSAASKSRKSAAK
jgi:hypothetical protein